MAARGPFLDFGLTTRGGKEQKDPVYTWCQFYTDGGIQNGKQQQELGFGQIPQLF